MWPTRTSPSQRHQPVQREDRLAGGHDRPVDRLAWVVAGLERLELGRCPVGHPLRCSDRCAAQRTHATRWGSRPWGDRLACGLGEQMGPGPRYHLDQLIPPAAGEQPVRRRRLRGRARGSRHGRRAAHRCSAPDWPADPAGACRTMPADQHLRLELPQQRRDDRVEGAQPAGIPGSLQEARRRDHFLIDIAVPNQFYKIRTCLLESCQDYLQCIYLRLRESFIWLLMMRIEMLWVTT